MFHFIYTTMRKEIFFTVAMIVMCLNISYAQNFDLNTLESKGREGAELLLEFTKYAATIVGLLSCVVTSYMIFARGQNSWQYIGAFVTSVLILGVGLTMFATIA